MRANVDRDSVVDLTRAMVAVDSRNPPGHERGAADIARQLLEPLGATFAEIEPASGRTSLLATVASAAAAEQPARPTLLINGHLDTVPVDLDGWTRDPFGGELDGDRLYGRGTADMKGGIAAAIEALLALRRAGLDPACDVVLHLVADEEAGGDLGTRVLAERGLIVADACLVPEPTSLGICVAERGLLKIEVFVAGQPAHASEPSRGVSAIEKAAKIVLALHGADFGGPTHPLLGSPTANAGIIAGGSAHNVVAERCQLTVDRRTLPGVTEAEAIAGLRAKIDAIGDPDLHYRIEPVVFGEASELATDHPWVESVQAAITAELGRPAQLRGMTFATDARFVRNNAGVPAVVFGPGAIEQAHVNDEWVSVDALVDAAAVMAHLMAQFDAETAARLRAGATAPTDVVAGGTGRATPAS
jgi:succinyl-diaminopimelate desuccinylase